MNRPPLEVAAVALPPWAGISMSAPTAATVRPSPTTAAVIGTARSVRPTPATVGSKHVARNFCRRVTFMLSSPYPISWRPSPCRTRKSCTICCCRPVPQPSSKSLAIPNISAPRSASSVCFTPGIKNSNITRMPIVWCPPAGAPIRGSWWKHPDSKMIFRATRLVRSSEHVLVCRLVEGKVTYVDSRLADDCPVGSVLQPAFRSLSGAIRIAARHGTTDSPRASHHAFDSRLRGQPPRRVWCPAVRECAPATQFRRWSSRRPLQFGYLTPPTAHAFAYSGA
jgi:hypothetical protein